MKLLSYADRPAKYVVRRTIAEALRRLAVFGELESYSYLGLGGVEFLDFRLMWHELGIHKMTSIEVESRIERFRFNAPFGSVKVVAGRAAHVLPNLPLVGLHIVWMDYVARLNVETIDDMRNLASRLVPGSVLLCTLNAHPTRPEAERLAELRRFVGEHRVAVELDDASLANWGTAHTQSAILAEELRRACRERRDGTTFRPIFNMTYEDEARMQVYGGILLADALERPFGQCHFEAMPLLGATGTATEVRAPWFTSKELDSLNQQLRLAEGANLTLPGFTSDELLPFVSTHRWYPG